MTRLIEERFEKELKKPPLVEGGFRGGLSKYGTQSATWTARKKIEKKYGYKLTASQYRLLKAIRIVVSRGERANLKMLAREAGCKEGEVLTVEDRILGVIPDKVFDAIVGSGEKDIIMNLARLINWDGDPKISLAAMRFWAELNGKLIPKEARFSKVDIGPVDKLEMKD